LAKVSNHSANSGKTFVARGLGKPWIHFGVFVGFTFTAGFQILSPSCRSARRAGVADFLEKVEMPEGVAGLGFRGVANNPPTSGYPRYPPRVRSTDNADSPETRPQRRPSGFHDSLCQLNFLP
jgi:hypothetical protein